MEAAIQPQRKPLITLNEDEQKVLKVGAFALGALVLGWIGFRLVRGVVVKTTDRKATRKSLDKEEPESAATRLYKAMDGAGTTETAIRDVFRSFKTWAEYREVAKAYEKKYQSILEDDLEGDLDETEFDEIMEIANELKLPKDKLTDKHLAAWNKRLRSAWDLSCWIFSCTDEDAAQTVLKDIRDKQPDPRFALRKLERFYKRQNHIELQDEAESEMSGEDLEKWNSLRRQIQNSRPQMVA